MDDVATVERAQDDAAAGECLRCGYRLVGIANEQACPECGLLAERSRRVTDELHESRPRWLRRLSWGVWWILIAVVSPIGVTPAVLGLADWAFRTVPYTALWSWLVVREVVALVPVDVTVLLLTVGVWLLASREGYPPVDRAEAPRRRRLRLALLGPWVALAAAHGHVVLDQWLYRYIFSGSPGGWGIDHGAEIQRAATVGVAALATLGSVPLVMLIARRLRDIAGRARSAHLAEHCVIVGVGTAATLAYVLAFVAVSQYAEAWGLGGLWMSRGWTSLAITTVAGVAGFLFVLWQLYLLVRFAIAFGAAARRLRRQWREDDRAEGEERIEDRG